MTEHDSDIREKLQSAQSRRSGSPLWKVLVWMGGGLAALLAVFLVAISLFMSGGRQPVREPEFVAVDPPEPLTVVGQADLLGEPAQPLTAIGKASDGETLKMVGHKGDWRQVRMKNGSLAWIHMGYGRTKEEIARKKASEASLLAPRPPIEVVRSKLVRTGFNLATSGNPFGAGWIVYVTNPEKAFNTFRKPLWVVVDDDAYPLNGPAKDLTPSLDWARDSASFKRAGYPNAMDLLDRFYAK